MRYLMLAVFLFATSAYAAPLEEAPEGNYDLVAVEVVHIPEEVAVGDGVVFVRHQANRGTDAIPPRTYRVDLYVDGECVSFDHGTGGLPPGRSSFYAIAEGAITSSRLNRGRTRIAGSWTRKTICPRQTRPIMSSRGPSSWPSARLSTTGSKRPNRPCSISSNSSAKIWWKGAIPPNSNLARIQPTKSCSGLQSCSTTLRL